LVTDWEKFLVDLAVAVIPVLTPFAIKLFAAYIELLRAKAKNERIAWVLAVVGDAVADTVSSANQTLVDDLKAAREDGKLTEEEKKQIKERVLGTVKMKLKADVMKALEEAFDSPDLIISDKIEAYLYNMT
jgi:hypothetical protein